MNRREIKGEPGTLSISVTRENLMATIPCAWCGRTRKIDQIVPGFGGGVTEDYIRQDVLRGSLTCGHCHNLTVFEIQENIIQYLPGRLYQGDIDEAVDENAREMLKEAILCFYGASYRGAVSFCRAAVEEALEAKGIKGEDLNAKIINAEKAKFLTDDEISLAHAARLIGRNALDRLALLSALQAVGSLTNAIDLTNIIALKRPAPASRSKKKSGKAS